MCSPGVDKRAKLNYNNCYAGVAELADAPALGAGVLDVQVQVLSPAPISRSVLLDASGNSMICRT